MSKKHIKTTHEDAKIKISSQHDIGIQLAHSSIELIKNGKNNSRSDVDGLKIQYDHWHDITSETLNEIFISSDYSYKFRKQKSSQIEYVNSSWQPDIKYYLHKEIKPKIDYLKMLVDNIEDFDEAPIEPSINREEITSNSSDIDMPLKERIETNLVIWLLSMLLVGFLAGLGTYKGILEIAKLDTVPINDYIKKSDVQSNYILKGEHKKILSQIKSLPNKDIFNTEIGKWKTWNGLFVDISERTGKPYLSDETIMMSSLENIPIAAVSNAIQEGVNRSWKYIGYRAGDFLALNYDSVHDSTGIGGFFLESVSNDTYVGYWVGKTCSNKSIVKCPYLLTTNSIIAAKDYWDKEKIPLQCQEIDIKNNVLINTNFNACTKQ